MSGGTSPWLIPAIIGGFLVVFPIFWCLIVMFLAHAGGWQKLARTYAAGSRPLAGTSHAAITGMVGWVSYRFVLDIHVAEEGLFLDVMPLFRMGHPRLFIPWEAVSARRKAFNLFWKTEALSIGTPVIAVITVPQGLLPAVPQPTGGVASPGSGSA